MEWRRYEDEFFTDSLGNFGITRMHENRLIEPFHREVFRISSPWEFLGSHVMWCLIQGNSLKFQSCVGRTKNLELWSTFSQREWSKCVQLKQVLLKLIIIMHIPAQLCLNLWRRPLLWNMFKVKSKAFTRFGDICHVCSTVLPTGIRVHLQCHQFYC